MDKNVESDNKSSMTTVWHKIICIHRVSFGPNHLYVFHHPQDYAKKVNAGEKVDTPTFDTAQEEIAKQSGLMTAGDGTSKGMVYSLILFTLVPV